MSKREYRAEAQESIKPKIRNWTQVEEFETKAEFNKWLRQIPEDRIKKVYRSIDGVYFVHYRIIRP